MRTRLVLGSGLAFVAAVAANGGPAGARGQAGEPTHPARLTGRFEMQGRVTAADNVRGEHKGKRAVRIWTFSSACATGQCGRVSLVRGRAGGTDRLTLRRSSPGHYTGAGRFYAPLRCGGQNVAKGESVPFTITVRITGKRLLDGVEIATKLHATYLNRSRQNLTRCVALPGHDAAVYTGRYAPKAASEELSARSPAGS